MNTEDLGNSKILNLLFKPAGMLMGSRVRRWLMNPMKTLQGAGIQPGQTVLEVGCGTGFFTIPAAPTDWRSRLLGCDGCFIRFYQTGVSKRNGVYNYRRC
jgi:2-polyprenyl-3-methyl-5-hydroxy-6-metoxy-1,4-benzoquinol methylase